MMQYDSNDVALALADAPIDPRTGNRVLYNVSWIANRNSMIGKRNEDWVRREIDWFKSGSDNLNDMEAPVPQAFKDCAGPDGTVNSAYGHILFGSGEYLPPEPTLAERILLSLTREGKATRHAVAIISDRDIHQIHRMKGRNDFICTNALNVMVDHEDRVHIIAQMRSMDAVWGYRADWSMWDYLMDWIVDRLSATYPEIRRGNIMFQVANLHVYPRHFELLEAEAHRIYDEQEREMRRIWMDQAMKEKIQDDARREAEAEGRLF